MVCGENSDECVVRIVMVCGENSDECVVRIVMSV